MYYLLDSKTGQFLSDETKDSNTPVLTDNKDESLLIGLNQLSLKMFYLYNSTDGTYVSNESKLKEEFIVTSDKSEALLFKENEIDLAWKVARDFAWQQLGQFMVIGDGLISRSDGEYYVELIPDDEKWLGS